MTEINKKVDPKMDENFVPESDESIIRVIWNFFSSMKLGIVLLLLMAIISIVGTIWIPEDPNTGQQDFTKFYNSIPFRLLMGLLAMNLLVCSANRWKVIVSTLKGPKADFSEAFIRNSKSLSSLKLKKGVTESAVALKSELKARGYRVFEKEDGNTIKIASDKGHIGILGPYITHLSFIVIIVAVLIKFSGLVGFEATLGGLPGQTYNLTSLEQVKGKVDMEDNFDLKIKDFRTEYRPDGSVKQWYSDVTVIDKEKTFDFSIYVNNPLIYNGLKFYQSSYGYQYVGKYSSPTKVDQAFNTGLESYVSAEGTDITFVPSTYNEATKKITICIYKGQEDLGEDEVALNTPYTYEQATITFEKVDGYTVLSVKKDPGVPYIGAGSIILILGIYFSFVFRQRRIWALITPKAEDSIVQITGISDKDKQGLEKDIQNIINRLNS